MALKAAMCRRKLGGTHTVRDMRDRDHVLVLSTTAMAIARDFLANQRSPRRLLKSIYC